MSDTKERILRTALGLFACDGYEAVSVRDIAGELGMTQGALYKHYRSKRHIFDCILSRMEQRDAERARAYGVPDGTAQEMPEAYRSASIDQLVDYAKAQFRYWTQDEFAAPFRRMLTLEQYRSPEMGRLYQQYLAAGPLDYTAELIRGMGLPRPAEAAAELYAPMFLFWSVYDGAEDKAAVLSALDSLTENIRLRLTCSGDKAGEEKA